MMGRISDVASGLLLGLVFGVMFTLLVPPVMPSGASLVGDNDVDHYLNGTDLGKIDGSIGDEFVVFTPCGGGRSVSVRSLHLAYTSETCASLPQ